MKKITALLLSVLIVLAMLPNVSLEVSAADASSQTDAPAFAKNLYDNGDGTYTLSLSVTGESDTSTITNVNKANVILVIDTSSSMNNDAAAGTSQDPHVYYTVPGTPTYSSAGVAPVYYRQDGNSYTQLYWRNNNWRETNSNNGTVFNGQFYARSRFWAEYHALTDNGGIIDSLLAQNTTLNPDIIEIAIASFGGKGATNLDFSSTSNTNAAAIKNVISGLSTSQGTNWEEGLQNAHDIIRTLTADEKENETTYVVFLTDGQPTTHANSYTVNQNVSDEFNAAKDDARTLVNTDKAEFYGVFTWGDQQYYQCVQSLVGYAYTGNGNYNTGDQGKGSNVFNATSTEALVNALKQIADTITNNVGYTDTGIHDGVTSMTSSSVKASATGDITGLKYYRSGGSYGTADPANGNYGTEWTGAPAATQGSDGVINWELGENFDLEDGVTYTVTFVVWPKQASLDLVADLNNGIISYDSLTAEQKSQITSSGGKYFLKTNTDYPSVSYKTYTQELDENGNPIPNSRVESALKVSEIDNPDPVSLAEEKLNALKIWEDSLDPSQRVDVGDSVTLYLKVDGKYYYKDAEENPKGVTLLKSEDWEKSDYISIAPGIMVAEGSPAYDANATQVTYNEVKYALIEEGHDYVFEESATDKHFELTAYHHHPMIMGTKADGSLHVVDVIFTYDEDGEITGIEDIKELSDSLSATNTLKGGINIIKTVVDETGAINDINPFTVKVTMTDPDGNALPTKVDGTTEYTIDYRIYYGPNNPNYNADDTSTSPAGGRSGHIYKTGTEFTETIYVGDTIRVVNVEDDTIYTVTETAPTGYEYVGTTYEIAYGGTAANRKLDPNHQVQGNSASYAEVKNKYTFGDLEVSKTVEVESGDAAKARAKEFEFTFKLYTDNTKATELTGLKYNYTVTKADGTTTTGTITEGGTFKLKDGEKIKIEKLPEGAYYEVTEAAASGYRTTSTGSTGTIEKNQTATAAFTNTYNVTPVKVDPPVHKVIENNGDLYNNGKFTFKINSLATSGQEVPMPTNKEITNSSVYELTDKPGYYEFGEIEFTKPGQYTYTVTETGSVVGVTNDAENTKTLVFTVTDNGDGTLSVSPTTDSAVFTFTNTYKAGELDITKTVVNAINTSDNTKFTFTVTLTDATGSTVEGGFPYTIGETTGTISSGGTLVLGNGETAKITEIPDGVTYTVKETPVQGYTVSPVSGEVTGTIDADADEPSKANFENTYGVTPVLVEFPVKKVVTVPDGQTGPSDWSYTINVAAAEGSPSATTMTGTVTKAAPTTKFGPFSFSKPGDYTYSVTESGTVPGVTNDTTTPKTVTVTISDNHDGTLKAEVSSTDENPLTFTNAYGVVPTTVSFPVKKVLEVPEGLKAGDITGKFTFTVTAGEGVPMPETTSYTNPAKDGGTVTFGEIQYTKPGTYTYTVTETGSADGVTNDTTSARTVTVTVTDNGNGTLKAEASSTENDPVTFKNTYNVEPVEVSFPVKKEVINASENLTGPNDWSFAVSVEAAEGSPKAETMSGTVTKAAPTTTFGPFEFEKPGTYKYTVTESGTVAGVTNDTETTKTITVTVTDKGNGKLEATVDSTDENPVTFTNTYSASGSVELEVKKVLTGRDWKTGESYSFKLVNNADGKTVGEEKTIDANEGTAKFDAFEFSAEDVGKTLKFTISETTDPLPAGVTASDPIVATVGPVVDNGDGTLTAAVSYSSDDTIINTYVPDPVKTKLTVEKVIEDTSGTAVDSTFTFTLKDNEGNDVEEIQIETENLTGEKDFKELEFDTAGTYHYVIVEKVPEETENGIVYDTTEYEVTIEVTDNTDEGQLEATVTSVAKKEESSDPVEEETEEVKPSSTLSVTFTNIYDPEDAKATVKVNKKIDDRSGSAPEDEKFVFGLYKGETKIAEASIVGGGEVKFADDIKELVFDKADVYMFTVKEIPGNTEGFTYSEEECIVTVTVTDPHKDGRLVAAVTYKISETNENTFTNVYEAEPATLESLDLRKVLEGLPSFIDPEKFTFTLTGLEIAPMPEVTTAEVTGSGTAKFGPITYKKAGTYTYTIAEQKGNTVGYTYDNTTHKAVVSVIDEGGKLKASVVYSADDTAEDEVVFTNTFVLTPVKLDPPVEKVIEGDPPTATEFVFVLEPVSNDADMPVADMPMPSESEEGTKTITVIGEGENEFGNMVFSIPGKYVYKIYEVDTKVARYTYDKSVYTLTVNVDVNGSELVLTSTYDKDGEEAEKVIFTNKYEEEPPETDATGEMRALISLTITTMLSAAGLIMYRRKREEEEK